MEPSDRILLCCDASSTTWRTMRFSAVVVETRDPQTACDILVALANKGGGTDNISSSSPARRNKFLELSTMFDCTTREVFTRFQVHAACEAPRRRLEVCVSRRHSLQVRTSARPFERRET